MPKWSPSFLDRIKNQVTERIEKRVRQELTPDINAPFIGEAPAAEDLDKPFLQRIKHTVKEKLKGLSPIQRFMLDPSVVLDDATIKYRIQYAGQNHLLLFMKYNNQWRHVEPMSYRISPKTKKLLFFGWCRIHDEVHSFRPERIQGLIVTDQVFTPRYPIEL
jgi:hypothetical protein